MYDLFYNDDRMYVLEISQAVVSRPDKDGVVMSVISTKGTTVAGRGDRRAWVLITRRNVRGYPPVRQNEFGSVGEALAYYKKVVVTTPRLSLGKCSPDPTPTLEEYTAWLKSESISDPVLNPSTDGRRALHNGRNSEVSQS
jgi:hypothetical protein